MRKLLFLSSLLLVTILVVSLASNVFAQTQCLSLSSDLGYGMTDSVANGSITFLQNYLMSAGYLFAAPNGHFGPATKAAVQSYQRASGISSTGYVGTLTRASLSQITCSQTVNSIPTIPASQMQNHPISNSSIITTPVANQTLSAGQSINIQWSSMPYPRFDLVLVSSSGSNMGFIAQSLAGVSQYSWNVGSVSSFQSQSITVVPNGSYQIRIQSTAKGAESSDPVSNQFTISSAILNISSVSPSVVPANGSKDVVLYGSGFTYNSSVIIGNYISRGTILYVSPDGSILVFTISTGTAIGSQTISVQNQNNQMSNQLQFTITPA